MLWIEADGPGPQPVSNVPGPALRMSRTSGLVEGSTFREDLDILAASFPERQSSPVTPEMRIPEPGHSIHTHTRRRVVHGRCRPGHQEPQDAI